MLGDPDVIITVVVDADGRGLRTLSKIIESYSRFQRGRLYTKLAISPEASGLLSLRHHGRRCLHLHQLHVTGTAHVLDAWYSLSWAVDDS